MISVHAASSQFEKAKWNIIQSLLIATHMCSYTIHYLALKEQVNDARIKNSHCCLIFLSNQCKITNHNKSNEHASSDQEPVAPLQQILVDHNGDNVQAFYIRYFPALQTNKCIGISK